MDGGTFDQFKHRVRGAVEAELRTLLSAQNDIVSKVAWYAASGGHRWRAMVVIAAGRIFDVDPFERCLPAGVGIELAHAASLVLDDLPSMDDGKLRRGQACTHIQFAEQPWAVDMAPVFMVNLAYKIALENDRVGYRERVESAQEMSRTSHTMIGGQVLDVLQSDAIAESDEERLLRCYAHKSGSLYASAAKVGAITARAGEDAQRLLERAGMDVGMAYQFMDDVCDVTASSEQSGKNPGQDAGNKETAVDLFGVDGARRRALRFQESALSALAEFGADANILRDIARNASWSPT